MTAAFPGEIRAFPFYGNCVFITASFCMRVLSKDNTYVHHIRFCTYNNRSIMQTKEADAEGVFWLQPNTQRKDPIQPWFTVHVPIDSFIQLKMNSKFCLNYVCVILPCSCHPRYSVHLFIVRTNSYSPLFDVVSSDSYIRLPQSRHVRCLCAPLIEKCILGVQCRAIPQQALCRFSWTNQHTCVDFGSTSCE